jgi:hypothetical protein
MHESDSQPPHSNYWTGQAIKRIKKRLLQESLTLTWEVGGGSRLGHAKEDSLQIYVPRLKKKSVGGVDAGGTLFLG